MTVIKKNCLNCTKQFNTRSQDVKRGHGKFCCRRCSQIFNKAHRQKPEPNVICALCHQEFHMSESKKKNSKSGFYFCCRAHKDKAQRIGGIQAIMPSHYGTANGIHTYREKAFKVKELKCERCGFDTLAALVVHHKDRNRNNNNISNLEVLCANCHAIEHWAATKDPISVP